MIYWILATLSIIVEAAKVSILARSKVIQLTV